jgi:DNA-binding transcriptional ArsR family regulator
MRRDVFQAIADPIRRDIINLLAKQSLSVNQVADNFEVSRPAISKHLKILEECDLLIFRRQGRERYCQINPKNLIPAFLWIDQYRDLWENKLDAFGAYLNQIQTKKKKDV